MTSPPNILLVDPDPAVRAALQFSLELDGFDVSTFATGEALIEEDVPREGCLVLDQRLPGLNGVSLLGRLRDRGVNLPAIILASSPSRQTRALVEKAGATLVEKPLLCDELTATIRVLIRPQAARVA